MTSSQKWIKDPSANLFYLFDFAQRTNKTGYADDYLQSNETITSAIINTDTDLQVSNIEIISNSTQVRFFVTGGIVDQQYNVTCRINTNQGQVDEFTKILLVKET
jgi:hypothetical protein